MAGHKGNPSGRNKSQTMNSTGIPTHFGANDYNRDIMLTRQYTDNDDRLAEHIKKRHPNRNVNKTEATNARGYRN